jgi:hypothetical protein
MEKLLFKAIVGSQSYGTSTPTSDIDYKGVYMQPIDDLISFRYKEQINVNKDECYYELRRFIELLQTANPTVLEMLYSPQNCIVNTSPEFELLVQNRDKFLTKKCLHSFAGYAIGQLKKSKGADKKMNWDSARVSEKTPLDFMYCHVNGKTMPINKWLEMENKNPSNCGLINLDHFKDCYALYYTDTPSEYNGLGLDINNNILLSSIPKMRNPDTIIHFNKNGYMSYQKDYNDYQKWILNRNESRYVDFKNHAQKIDGKNLTHCMRLLDMAKEIATHKTINVMRPNAEYLLSIRRGEMDLDSIIQQAEIDLKNLENIYAQSDLPEYCDFDFTNDLLIKIRRLNEI